MKIYSRIRHWKFDYKESGFFMHKVKKLCRCLKFLLGGYREKRKIIWKGENLYFTLLTLYSLENQRIFEEICKASYVKSICGHKFVKYIYSRLYKNVINYQGGGYLPIEEDKIEAVVKQVADSFLGGVSRYDTLQIWFMDADSRHLLDLEILQKILEEAGWSSEFSSVAMCTGISKKEWHVLCQESQKSIALPEFLGRRVDDAYVNFAKTAVFLLNQYEYKDFCTVRSGDVFFDCGACFGDTAIWAAEKVGKTGTVVAFEPIKEQENVLRENVKRYLPGKSVRVENLAVSDCNGLVSFVEGGEGSRLSETGEMRIQAVKIDDYCQSRGIWPDYIKMDIEGSELAALRGAETTIRERKPRLAICVYHKPAEDLWGIPYFLKACVPSYRFYLKKSHYTWETVLFAVAE